MSQKSDVSSFEISTTHELDTILEYLGTACRHSLRRFVASHASAPSSTSDPGTLPGPRIYTSHQHVCQHPSCLQPSCHPTTLYIGPSLPITLGPTFKQKDDIDIISPAESICRQKTSVKLAHQTRADSKVCPHKPSPSHTVPAWHPCAKPFWALIPSHEDHRDMKSVAFNHRTTANRRVQSLFKRRQAHLKSQQ